MSVQPLKPRGSRKSWSGSTARCSGSSRSRSGSARRQATRLFGRAEALSRDDLVGIEAGELLASRVFKSGIKAAVQAQGAAS